MLPAMRRIGKAKKELIKTSNLKYEITDIPHETYPFLHRIRALRDIGKTVKAGDLGGFVESESNLSVDPDDDAWIFDDAIAAGDAYVDQNSCLRDAAIACDSAYVSHGSVLSDHARAEDSAYLRGGVMNSSARASGFAQLVSAPNQFGTPLLSGHCQVYGIIRGDVRITGSAVVLPGEEILNDTKDTFVLTDKGRSIVRGRGRDMICPSREPPVQVKKPKERGLER